VWIFKINVANDPPCDLKKKMQFYSCLKGEKSEYFSHSRSLGYIPEGIISKKDKEREQW
jgi:hypothetical protein